MSYPYLLGLLERKLPYEQLHNAGTNSEVATSPGNIHQLGSNLDVQQARPFCITDDAGHLQSEHTCSCTYAEAERTP
ncbi:hypothetical protein EVAR_64911_1 [Eumeta japonica]|uniref:Uncharacterized protein n=1 Tax=Eumeta variegata TaxID=151549 RepID=A0A4C1ZL28_EUMVA|nr:hypothetical protein EVAR_64911_1 [Eumeta japonica]